MPARAELLELNIRLNQDIAEFYITLEELASKANPDDSMQNQSLEFAHILL